VNDWSDRLGWFIYPTQTNFIFAEPKNSRGETGLAVAKALYEFLLSRKILVRAFPSHALTAPFLRISVGSDDEMFAVNSAIEAWLAT
jgi:histidinol-phosphate aminotransferase